MNSTKRNILIAWCVYDWAISAFPIIVTTFIFATYFTTSVAANKIIGTYEWANATALAGVIIAFTSPILGAIADYSGHHKRWLFVFTLLCIISSAGLWYAYPAVNSVNITLTFVVIGTISLEIATVFYNAFLPHISPKNYLGRVSGWAWGLGYLGGIIALGIALVLFIKGQPAWLNIHTAEQVRICGPLTAMWFALFSIPFFFLVPDIRTTQLSMHKAIRKGFFQIAATLKTLPQQKNMVLYLLAHMVYADGLNTLFAFGGIYAGSALGMNLSEVVLFGITMNLSAGIGAIVFAWIDDYIGSKQTILISLACLILVGIPLLTVNNPYAFWFFGLLLSLFVGPVQAASRSLMAHLTQPQQATELFGLYAFSGKITAFMGPWLLGWVTLHFNSQRLGMATTLLFFMLGGLLLWRVKAPRSALRKSS